MSSIIGENDRKIVPRWRSFRSSIANLSAPQEEIPNSPTSPSFQSNLDDWQADRNLWNALDLVAGAIVENRLDLAEDAVEHIEGNRSTPPAALLLLNEFRKNAANVVDVDLPLEARCRAEIRSSRQRLNIYPFDAIQWIDLARNFTTLGLLKKANKSVAAALKLAPHDVFVLRAASRFHLQQGDLDKAQWVLTNTPKTQSNPWLLASELAAASVAGRGSSLMKVARRMEKADFRPEDLTELRAAMATSEIEAGSNAIGKKLLRRSLQGANENSLAQVLWMDRTRLGNIIDISTTRPPNRNEAKAWNTFFEGKWQESAAAALLWFEDQPFSTNAGIFCSYVLSDLMNMPGQALEVLAIALKSNRDNHILQNNLAYIHIQLGNLEKAESILSSIALNPTNTDDATLEATLGLLAFRKGHLEQGRTLYNNAINTFLRNGIIGHAGRAATYLAIEEVKLRTPFALTAAKRALAMTKDGVRADISQKLDQLQQLLKLWASEPDGPA